MISEELEAEIEAFFVDLMEAFDEDKEDFTEIYQRHPTVRIGLRRALLTLEKRGWIKRV